MRGRREWNLNCRFEDSDFFFLKRIRPVTIQSQLQAHASFWAHITRPLRRRRRPVSALASSSLVMAMLCRLAARGAATKALLQCPKLVPPFLAASAAFRFFGTGGGDAASPPERLALEMIQYALELARSQKSGDSYSHAMLVLEQGMSNLREGGGGAVEGSSSSDNAVGMILLAMSTLLYERGELQDANEKLEMVHQLGRASIDLIVAACEGRVGLNLETGQDANSLLLADGCSHLLRASEESGVPVSEVTKFRAKSIKGLVDLINGDLESAYSGSKECGMGRAENQLGTSLLSQGEISHCTGNFSLSKELYEKALLTSETKNTLSTSYVASTNMVPEEVTIGAGCALGQLLSHSGKFTEAEEQLTKALVKAEEHFGSTHPKVGVILTCIAIMYKRKAQVEASSSILIQEGLYRKATDLLKAPNLNEKVVALIERSDIIALARGGYADLLCIQQNRREEGERMKLWAESMWRNKRLSLAEALEFPEPTKAAVIDTRTCRVL